MIQRFIKISLDIQIPTHIRLTQCKGCALHQIRQRNRFLKIHRKCRFTLSNVILGILELYQKWIICKAFKELYHCFLFRLLL